MNRTEHEVSLQRQIRGSENHLDRATLNRLSEIRAGAVEKQNQWFVQLCNEYRGLFSATLVAASVFAVLILPNGENLLDSNQGYLEVDDSLAMLMDEPEFYLWLDETGQLLAER